jgi:hypothetical protein
MGRGFPQIDADWEARRIQSSGARFLNLKNGGTFALFFLFIYPENLRSSASHGSSTFLRMMIS